MAYCKNCGAQIAANDNHCPYCGVAQSSPVPLNGDGGQAKFNKQGAQVVVIDNGGPLWFMLGFCIPLAGLIIFVVYNGVKPNTARSAGMGALVMFVIRVALGISFTLMGAF
jgi:hypothetical protein